jgi:sigma-B regulation protein RsbU (phosphoserine phosphatase)
MTRVNRELSNVIVDESFATAFYAVVDADASRIRYASAGHPPPMHFHADGAAASELPGGSVPLGILADEAYETYAEPLAPGDVVLCYTDGVTEAADGDGRMLNTDGLARLAAPKLRSPGKADLEGIYRAAKDHCGSVDLPDDVLLLSMARLPDRA